MTPVQAKTVLIHLRDKLQKTGAKPKGILPRSPGGDDVDGLALAMTEDLLEDVRKGKTNNRRTDAKMGVLYGLVLARGHVSLEDLSRYEKTAAPMASLNSVEGCP